MNKKLYLPAVILLIVFSSVTSGRALSQAATQNSQDEVYTIWMTLSTFVLERAPEPKVEKKIQADTTILKENKTTIDPVTLEKKELSLTEQVVTTTEVEVAPGPKPEPKVVSVEVLNIDENSITSQAPIIKAAITFYAGTLTRYFDLAKTGLLQALGYVSIEEAGESLYPLYFTEQTLMQLGQWAHPGQILSLRLIVNNDTATFWYLLGDKQRTKRADVFKITLNGKLEYIESIINFKTDPQGRIILD